MGRMLSCWIALSLTAVACGDDGMSGDKGSAGSSSNGNGGSGGFSAGTGGSSGSSTYQGGPADEAKIAACKTFVNPSTLPSGCYSCICEADAPTVIQCDATCWDLIDCAAKMCGDAAAADKQSCVQSKCADWVTVAVTSGSAGAVPGVSALLAGSQCGDICSASQ